MKKNNPEIMRQITDLWNHGVLISFISEAYDINPATLYRWVNEAMLPRRQRGVRRSLTDDLIDIAKGMRSQGMKWDKVAAKMGFEKRYLQMRVAGQTRSKRKA